MDEIGSVVLTTRLHIPHITSVMQYKLAIENRTHCLVGEARLGLRRELLLLAKLWRERVWLRRTGWL